MCKVVIFAGTTEGRKLASYLDRQQVKTYVCTATEYGESLIAKSDYIEVLGKRLSCEEMKLLFKEKKPQIVVDATHPYATIVSDYVKEACEDVKISYLRLLREKANYSKQEDEFIYVDSVKEASDFLKHTTGNVFVTTGSKELKEYTSIENYKERIYARILSSKDAIFSGMELGFQGKNLICMQGPFNEELNYAMLKQTNARYLVTKEAGKNGGFLEKINAAASLNIKTIIIGRPKEAEGYIYSQVIERLNETLSLSVVPREIFVIGIGMGNQKYMTKEAIQVIKEADVLFGAFRMLNSIHISNKPKIELYKKEEILEYLKEHIAYRKIAVLVSGDVGFYSAANGFLQYFKQEKVTYICGISSLSYLCAKIGKSWEHVKVVSNHGKQANTIDAIRRYFEVFSLMGGKDSVKNLMQELIYYEYTKLRIWIGENLGYETEKIYVGSPEDFLCQEFDTLCVVLIENPDATTDLDRLKDEEFIRGAVPMTKEEIRTVSISKLGLKKDSILYDIGAGTGSVSIQAAMKMYEGCVYAIEKKPEGVSLIKKNMKKFKVSNIKVIKGTAPEALNDLPMPTHAFIGGSSGSLSEIIKLLFRKNPNIKLVINAITLETITQTLLLLKELSITNYEITQLQAAKSKTVGNHHMMIGQNPVTIISIS